jgi:8-amino-7-oxononanoate synthase
MSKKFSVLTRRLQSITEKRLYRVRRIVDSAQGVEVQMDGLKLLNFCGNNYLGLANHPEVVKAFKEGADKYGVGSGSAHLISGHTGVHHKLEENLAEFTGRERALLFSTGYMANLGVISALLSRTDAVFEDRLNHASLLDGGLLSGARFKRYQHADTNSLESALEKSAAKQKLIVTDGVFSMDGDLAPLSELTRLAGNYKAWLMVDDAHGLAVLGAKGGGIVEHLNLTQQQVPILMGTLGKGFGTFGAFVAGSEVLIESLIQMARTYVYTTAMPAAVAEATCASLKLVINETWRREKLHALVAYFYQGATQLGLQLKSSPSAIQPIIIGDSQRALEVSKALLEEGFFVSAIRPPTVPEGSARLRITFSALHKQQHVDRLLTALEKILL